MATHYIHEYRADTTANALVKANAATPDLQNAHGIFAVGNVVYNGKSGANPADLQNFEFTTQNLSKTIRLNSQTDSTTLTGNLIGFQSKPRCGITRTSDSLIGAEIGPSVSDGVVMTGASGSVIGLHAEFYLRGTSAGTIGGNCAVLELEQVTDDGGTRDVTGYVTAIRIRKVFSAGTVSGTQSAIRIEKPEAQTGSESYDCVLDLTGTVTGCWHDTDADSGDTEAGYFAVKINNNKRYVLCYSDAPTL